MMQGGEYMWISGDKVLADLNDANRDKCISCLNFSDVYFTDANIQRMELALKGRKFARIGIMNCRGRVEDALKVIFDCVHVECLKLDCLQIKAKTAQIIGEGVATCSSLKCLVFQAMCVTDTFAKALHQGLSKTTSLESLYWSSITARPSDLEWGEIILDSFRQNRTLKHFGIARVRGMEPADVFRSILGHETLESISIACMDGIDQSALSVLDAISKCHHGRLTTIKLSVRGDWTNLRQLPTTFNGRRCKYQLTISTSSQYCDMQQLGEILERNDAIESLSLGHCGLGEDDLADLANYLGRVRGLKYLSLLGNSLNSGRGCQALVAALQENRTIERIDLPAVVEQKPAIDQLLDWNRAGRRLFLDLDAPVSLWPLVLHRAGTIDYTRSYPLFRRPEELAARRANALFHLLQGQILCN